MGTDRVLRGGAWYGCVVYVRSALRLSFVLTYWGDDHGFRCVRSQ